LLLSGLAALLPGYSGRKSLLVGWRQHSVVPGPNSGWSEAATAGAIQRKLIGPIWAAGKLVTEIWLGDSCDAPAADGGDLQRSAILVGMTGLLGAILAVGVLASLAK